MALVELTSGSQALNAAIDSASITPTANALVLMFVLKWAGNTADPTVPTIDTSGIGLTFDLMDTVIIEPNGTSRGRLEVYRAQGASPTTGVVNFNFTGSGGGGGIWWIGEDTNVPVGNNGDDAVIQVLSDAEDGSATAFHFGTEDEGVPLSSFADAANKTVFCVCLRGTATYDTTITFDGDLTPFTKVHLDDSVDWILQVAHRTGANLTPGCTYPDSSAAAGGFALEIDEETPVVVSGVYPHRRYYQRRVK